MPTYTPPEILRANLAEVILKMIALNLGDISVLPFIDSPPQKSISDGFNLLTELGAIFQGHPKKNKKENKRYFLTAKGRMMSKIPADPRLSCMLIEAQKRGCLEEVLIIASALSIADPREKAPENQKAVD